MDKEQARHLREQAEAIYETRKFAGNCPRWYRRRDARHEVVNQFTGMKASERTRRRAQFVVDNGIPALLKAMDAGTIKIAAAVEIATLTHSEQNEVMADAALRRVFLRAARDVVPEGRPAKVAVSVDRTMADALVTAGLLDADESGSKSAIGEAIANALKIMFLRP
jgi:translation initiation factor 2B subunit (eIF-2B alpha/beta/delta family)